MRLDYLTIFPDFLAPLRQSLTGKAADRGLIELRVHDLRAWTHDRHRTVDDTPYGGGAVSAVSGVGRHPRSRSARRRSRPGPR